MWKKLDFKRFKTQVLIFLVIMMLGLLNHCKAQTMVYAEDFSACSDGAMTSPKWEVEISKAAPDVFWVQNQKFDCKDVKGEGIWRTSLMDISAFPEVTASVSLFASGTLDAADFIRVYYNVDGKGEILFSTNGNETGNLGSAVARQPNITGNDLQIVIHISNNASGEKYSFDNILVQAQPVPVAWTGAADSLWNNPLNWAAGKIPTATDDVVIQAGSTVKPVITDWAECNSITIEKHAMLRLSTAAILRVHGNFQNSGTFLPGTGTVKFAGDAPQTVESAGAAPLPFYNLNINNRSQKGVVVIGQIAVISRLSLFNGCITTADTLFIRSDAPDAIAVYSDSSYIVGKLQRRIKNSVEADYSFPVGWGGVQNFHPAWININSLEGTKFITVSFQPLERYIQSAIRARDNDMNYEYIVSEGMWVVVPDAEPAGGWYDLKLGLNNVSGLTDNLFGILKRPVGSGPEAWTADFGEANVFGGEGRKLSDGFALKKYCTSFSELTLAGTGLPIPIELLNFHAEISGSKVNLDWTTATETNNAFFTVEKSNGTDFKEVMRINANGNSAVEKKYSAIDEKPFTGISYYRLRQTDFNGVSKVTDVVSVKNDGTAGQLVLFPNPAQGVFKMKFLTSVSKADIVIYNQQGTISFNKSLVNLSGNQLIELSLKDELIPGVYYMQVSTGTGDMSIQKMVIE